MLSRCHGATVPRCHLAALPRRHPSILSRCHPAILRPYHAVTLPPYYPATLLPCHTVTLPPCHPATLFFERDQVLPLCTSLAHHYTTALLNSTLLHSYTTLHSLTRALQCCQRLPCSAINSVVSFNNLSDLLRQGITFPRCKGNYVSNCRGHHGAPLPLALPLALPLCQRTNPACAGGVSNLESAVENVAALKKLGFTVKHVAKLAGQRCGARNIAALMGNVATFKSVCFFPKLGPIPVLRHAVVVLLFPRRNRRTTGNLWEFTQERFRSCGSGAALARTLHHF